MTRAELEVVGAEAAGRAIAGAEVEATGRDGGVVMRMRALILVALLSLLAAGCASLASPSLTPLPSARTAVLPTYTHAPTVTPSPRPAVTIPPTSTRRAPTLVPTQDAGQVTITIVYDNNPGDDGRLRTAWGFSCLVEGLEETILFDTGGDSATLLHNMRALELRPGDVDAVVLSHIHSDHVGGLPGFLEENHDVVVYAPQSFPKGIKDATEKAGAELIEVQGPVEICRYAHSVGELGDGIKEQALVVETSQGLVVITGCAHPGIVYMVEQAKELLGREIYLVVGGFHLGGASTAEIARIVEEFQRLGVQKAAPCHCSGDAARALFEESYGEEFIQAGGGSKLKIRD